MISEVENIKKGLVVSTVEFDTSKKIIGVSTANLVPKADGVAPLEKQGAFQVPETTETIDFAQAINNTQMQGIDQIAESIELPVLGAQTENTTLKAPVTTDVISENPVQVENPANLTGFEMPSMEAVQEEVKEETPSEPVAMDIQMPEMPSVVVADEPTGLNESLFEGAEVQAASASILEEAAPAVVQGEIAAPAAVTPEVPETTMNIEMPTIPTQTVTEEAKVEAVTNDIMGAIPTTAPAEEIPTFDIEMPVIDQAAPTEVVEEVKVEEQAPVVAETPAVVETQVVEETLPAVEETLPTVEEQQEVAPAAEQVVPETIEEVKEETSNVTSELNTEDILKTYKESMEAIINNFNKAQKELLDECIAALRRANTVNKEEVAQVVMEQPVQETVQTTPQETVNVELTPGNPLESAAFEIIDAMSAPKM